jgi:phosphoserine phosphatase
MSGQVDFKESLRRRVSLLAGTPTTVYDAVRQKLVLQDGAKLLCSRLKTLGFKLAVISGGFIPLAKYVQQELGLDYAFANTVRPVEVSFNRKMEASEDGRVLTGKVLGDIVDGQRKKELLETIAQQEAISLDQVSYPYELTN